MPFFGPDEKSRARVQLEQVKPKLFRLLTGFVHVREKPARKFVVTPETLGETDLTSVPFGFRWFVNTYGRHTLPALLHDCLIDPERARLATPNGVEPPTRQGADDIFLETLGEQGVATIRRLLMWSAVTFNTRFTYLGWLSRILMLVWCLAALGGTACVYLGVTRCPTDFLILVGGVVGPLPFAFLWGRSWLAGMCFGYGIVLLLPASVVVHASYLLYWICEKAFQVVGLSKEPPSFRHF